VRDVGLEVLDDDLGLLREVVVMESDEPGDRAPGLRRLVGGVVCDGLLETEVGLVGRVVLEHVVDEAFFDRLAHRVQVERLVPVRSWVEPAEQLQRLALGSGRKREETHVLLASARGYGRGERLLDGVGRKLGIGVRPGRRAEDAAKLLRGVTGLRGVGLVHDDCIAPARQVDDLVQHERELLQRGDDHAGLLAGQRGRKLLRGLVDPLNYSVRVLELVDRVLQLAIENDAVGDHHDLVEDLVVSTVQRGQAVRQPGDRVGLARPRGVLHQVGMARPLLAGRRLQPHHRIPLVGAREDHSGRLPRALRRLLYVHEPTEQIEPCVALPHPLPQVGRGVSARVLRVARTPLVALVERQEPRVLAGEAGGHRDALGVDGEVDDDAGECAILRIPIGAVLTDRVLDALTGHRILQFCGGDRKPVHEKRQIYALRRRGVVHQLPRRRQPVLAVAFDEFGSQPVGRLEVRESDRDALVDDPVPKHVHHAALVALRRDAVGKLRLCRIRVISVTLEQLVPTPGLRRADEREQLCSIHAPDGIEVAVVALLPVVLDEVVLALLNQFADSNLEVFFFQVTHGGPQQCQSDQ
jgi:hypothetical protein